MAKRRRVGKPFVKTIRKMGKRCFVKKANGKVKMVKNSRCGLKKKS